MIVFELICDKEHRFEGWFSSGDDFDRQLDRGLISCPMCSSASIKKLLMAKMKRGEAAPRDEGPSDEAKVPVAAGQHAQLMAFIDHVLSSSENVGDRFAEEARKIHRREAPERGIRGVASRAETEELLEEGISVLPLPIPPQTDWH